MTARTVINRHLAAGYKSQRHARCSRLTLVNRRRRRQWGQRHRVWDIRHWINFIFNDEFRFYLYHSDGRAKVQSERLIDACIQPTHGNCNQSFMVWGTIHHGGMSNLVSLDGTMYRHRYIQIPRDHMLPWRRGVFRQNFAFVQDDTFAYVTRDTAASLDKHDVKVMDWPAVCPDMNPIEHVWDYNMVGVAVSMVISTMHVKPYIDSHKAQKNEKKKRSKSQSQSQSWNWGCFIVVKVIITIRHNYSESYFLQNRTRFLTWIIINFIKIIEN